MRCNFMNSSLFAYNLIRDSNIVVCVSLIKDCYNLLPTRKQTR